MQWNSTEGTVRAVTLSRIKESTPLTDTQSQRNETGGCSSVRRLGATGHSSRTLSRNPSFHIESNDSQCTRIVGGTARRSNTRLVRAPALEYYHCPGVLGASTTRGSISVRAPSMGRPDTRQARFMAHVHPCVVPVKRRDPTMTATATSTHREERRQTRYARARCATVNTGPSTVPKPRCGVREPAQLQLVPARASAAPRWNRENPLATRWGGHGSTKARPLAPSPGLLVEQATPQHETRYSCSLSVPRPCLVSACLEHRNYFAPRRCSEEPSARENQRLRCGNTTVA